MTSSLALRIELLASWPLVEIGTDGIEPRIEAKTRGIEPDPLFPGFSARCVFRRNGFRFSGLCRPSFAWRSHARSHRRFAVLASTGVGRSSRLRIRTRNPDSHPSDSRAGRPKLRAQ